MRQGSHTRRGGFQGAGPPGIAAVAILMAALVTAWIFRADLGVGATTAQTDNLTGGHDTGHSALSPADSKAPIDASQAPSSGPVSEADKQLLVKVRQADLWELPAGRFAQDNGSMEQVKRAGLHLMEGHSRLDQMVREIATALAVPIPDKPTADQRSWLRTLETTKGAEFDRFFANQLRDSHGKVFVAIAKVRATTQNSVIRDLAIEANKQVADHMEVLEDTGLVKAQTFDAVADDVLP
jgi:predicted outer membrane protein